jgi:hypothetical protein
MRRYGWWLLVLLALVAVTMVLVPTYLIRPFASQTETAVSLSYALRRWSPLVTGAIAAIVLVLAIGLWRRGSSRWRQVAVVPPVLLVLAAAWFSRQRYFEWMFAPLPNAQYVRAGDAAWVGAKDMVLAVAVGGDVVAYPVRQLAYHHLVQDVVGRVPIVATY